MDTRISRYVLGFQFCFGSIPYGVALVRSKVAFHLQGIMLCTFVTLLANAIMSVCADHIYKVMGIGL
jgi:hypothetical protein